MPPSLDEEEIQEIYDVWDELGEEPGADQTYTAVAAKVDADRDTVSKYIKQREDEEYEEPEDFDSIPALDPDGRSSSLFPDPGQEAAEAITTFLNEINHEYGLGIKDKAIKMIAGEVRNSGILPQPDALSSFLESADTNVSNTQDIMWVARQYTLWLQKYQARKAGTQRAGVGSPGGMGGMPMGGQQPSQGMGLTDNGLDMNAGQTPPGLGGGGMNPMALMFQQMQQQIQRLEQKLDREPQQSDDDILERKTQQFLETKLEQLIEADSTAEQEAIVSELRALRRQVEQGSVGGAPELGEDWRTDLIQLAREGAIEFDDAKDILEEVGEIESDPQVLEKRYDKEIEEMRIEHESERYDKLATILETASSNVGKAMGEALISGSGPGADAADESTSDPGETAPAEPAAPDGGATAPPESAIEEGDPCKHCETTMTQTPGGSYCPECDHALMGCDRCGEPIEVPPIGQADYWGCPECDRPIEVPGDDDATVECPECTWSGPTDDLDGEHLLCNGCDTFRPIQRTPDIDLDALAGMAD